jgi:hypothetical protein
MKYSLYHDIDLISDESLLYKLSLLVKSMLAMPKVEQHSKEDDSSIPDFVRNMSVKTDIPANVNVKNLMHQHWEDIYG